MVASLLVVDPDPVIGELLADQLGSGMGICKRATGAEEAATFIAASGTHLLGLVTAVDLPGDKSGWEIARLARQANPDIAIGYRARERDKDWPALGVPDSVLLGIPPDAERSRAFLQLCLSHRAAEPPADAAPDQPSLGALFGASLARLEGGAEPEFARLHSALYREREALQTLFEKAPSFIAFLEGPDHRFTYANEAYLEIVERTAVVGQTVLELFPEVVAQGFLGLLDRVYRTGEAYHAHGMQFDVRRPDGVKTSFLDFAYNPVRGSSGEVTGIFVQGIDVTERRTAQEQIGTLQNQLIHVARINALGTLVSALAHELNQPLTSIQNYMAAAVILAEREALSPQITDCLKGTGDAALRAGKVIRRLREMATRRDFNKQPMRLAAAVRETTALAAVGPAHCTILVGELSDASIVADRIQIQQVLLNLIQNAFEAGGDAPCEVRISTIDRGAYVEVVVSDTGPGIKPELLPTVFDSFVTTKGNGMGVGLSISRTIIEAHGGTISASNDAAGGARFSFTLPKIEAVGSAGDRRASRAS